MLTTPDNLLFLHLLDGDLQDKLLHHLSRDGGEAREVPADWKLANVIHLYKMGMSKYPRNYSAVSPTSVPRKIMKKIILCGIQMYLKNMQS